MKSFETSPSAGYETESQNYEHGILSEVITKYPEMTELVGDVQFTPEQFASSGDQQLTFGQQFFPEATPDQLREFERTSLSVVLLHYVRDGKYDEFTQSQPEATKMQPETFGTIRNFIVNSFDTDEKRDLLEYFIVINDLGKSQNMIAKLKEHGIETLDHDEVLSGLLKLGLTPSMERFSPEAQENIKNVLAHGINFGQLIQGECTDYSFNDLANLSPFEKDLMSAEAMMDIAGVAGHANQKGSIVLNQPTAENFILGAAAINAFGGKSELFDNFVMKKAEMLGISEQDHDKRRAIARICLMMRLNDSGRVVTVEKYMTDNSDALGSLVGELNITGFENEPAILPYYAPALLSNMEEYFKKSGDAASLESTLKIGLPFLNRVFEETRNGQKDQNRQGVITMMLRDAAAIAGQNPLELEEFHSQVVNEYDSIVGKG